MTNLNVDSLNILHEKAKTRKNGIYRYKGFYWVVKDNNFIAYADKLGNCYQRMGAFNAIIGKVESYLIKKSLQNWLKIQP